MSGPTDGALGFDEREVEVAGVARRFLVARPRVAVKLDLERLESMARGDFVSRVDMEILQAVAARGGEIAIVVFDAMDESSQPLWSFDPKLSDEQRMELGRLLLRSQLALYRELVRMRAGGLVGVGFGKVELATFQRATVRVVSDLSEELESAEPPRAAQIQIDLWLGEHAARWSGLVLEDYVSTKLAGDIAESASLRPEIEQLMTDAGGG